jgi:parvulin-like peptidyl-prolyl isomerase
VTTKSNRNFMHLKIALSALLIGMMLGEKTHAAAEAPSGDVEEKQPVFATVGKTVITQQEFDAAFAAATRAKFYHGKPPDIQIATLQREVGDKLITNVLLVREAKRRKLKPDSTLIDQQLASLEKRYLNNEEWQKVRAQELPRITRQFQDKNLLDQLEKLVRNVPAPTEKQLREYYAAHMDKFTAPEQQRVSLILLRVDPSSPTEVWQQAFEEGKVLASRLHGGADFAEMAREHSGDSSADQGGDMGYLHSGMLSEAGQEQVNKLKPGEISDPVVMMEGVAIFRLTDRIPPKINKFEDVEERARGLWLIEQSNSAWQSLITELKKKTPVSINESLYLPLAAATADKPVADKPAKTK